MINRLHKALTGTIAKHRMILPGQTILAAVSGGADSTAMLLLLSELSNRMKFRLVVAHLNHRIRGRDADADANFVKRLAVSLHLPCVAGSTDVPALARRKGISMEMAAREARYSYLASTARNKKADAIATAHNADDQAETILLRLGRGAGPTGLSGISHVTTINGVRIVRPLLDVPRTEITAFLREAGQKWREDKSNNDIHMLRNLVRHDVLPYLESRLSPGIRQTLRRVAEVMRAEHEFMHDIVSPMMKQFTASPNALKVTALRARHVAVRRRIIHLWLMSLDVGQEAIDFDAIERIDALLAVKRGSSETQVAGGLIVRKEYDLLVAQVIRIPHGSPLSSFAAVGFRHAVLVPGETILPETGLRIRTSISKGIHKPKPSKPGTLPAQASISLDAIGDADITVRSWNPGDRMKPLGFHGSKKLKEIFIDAKVPLTQRHLIPIFECRGEIIWLPGYRVAQGWEVSSPAASALQIKVSRKS